MHALHQRHLIGHAVDRRGRAEHDALHAVLAHRLAQGEGAVQVVAVVFEGLFHALAHGLVSRKVDDRVKRVGGEHLVQLGGVGYIHVIAANMLAGDGFETVEHALAGVVEVVRDDGLVAGLDQFHIGMGADKARATREKDFHEAHVPFLFNQNSFSG